MHLLVELPRDALPEIHRNCWVDFMNFTFAWSRIAALHADIDAVWMLLSTGLSLPNETGRGLSEHGDASRDTLSESSSLSTAPRRFGSNYIFKYQTELNYIQVLKKTTLMKSLACLGKKNNNNFFRSMMTHRFFGIF